MTASFVLGSSKSSTYPEGTPPVSTRLRPCWTAILSTLCGCSLVVPLHFFLAYQLSNSSVPDC